MNIFSKEFLVILIYSLICTTSKTRNVSIGHGCPHTPLFCQSYDSRSNIFGLHVPQVEN
jgi:hypothetical protein